MNIIPKSNVVHKYEKRSLLIAINSVAALSIFFFGYDQGLMSGVNNTVNYYDTTMKFGHLGSDGAIVTDKPLLQGGIVSLSRSNNSTGLRSFTDTNRLPSTTWALSSALWLEAPSVIVMAVSRPLLLVLPGASLVLLFNALLRTMFG